jgi:hypothetical protein
MKLLVQKSLKTELRLKSYRVLKFKGFISNQISIMKINLQILET